AHRCSRCPQVSARRRRCHLPGAATTARCGRRRPRKREGRARAERQRRRTVPRTTAAALIFPVSAICLLALPDRTALVQECAHALLRVLPQGVVGHYVGGALVGCRLVQGKLIVEGALAESERRRARG